MYEEDASGSPPPPVGSWPPACGLWPLAAEPWPPAVGPSWPSACEVSEPLPQLETSPCSGGVGDVPAHLLGTLRLWSFEQCLRNLANGWMSVNSRTPSRWRLRPSWPPNPMAKNSTAMLPPLESRRPPRNTLAREEASSATAMFRQKASRSAGGMKSMTGVPSRLRPELRRSMDRRFGECRVRRKSAVHSTTTSQMLSKSVLTAVSSWPESAARISNRMLFVNKWSTQKSSAEMAPTWR
mmetsp:Transcript_30484/g.94697  ORF Transcript_30484/g.94697 Transcript_30484/m.94697 type:complete len:239 (+) Transcript_30484:350-1066(+)